MARFPCPTSGVAGELSPSKQDKSFVAVLMLKTSLFREVEFWAGKPSRLHDRVRYLLTDGSPDDIPQWKIERLAP